MDVFHSITIFFSFGFWAATKILDFCTITFAAAALKEHPVVPFFLPKSALLPWKVKTEMDSLSTLFTFPCSQACAYTCWGTGFIQQRAILDLFFFLLHPCWDPGTDPWSYLSYFCGIIIIEMSDFSVSYLYTYFSDMQKFPLRMKDNDLLVTELYHDPSNDAITALSVYLTPKTSLYHFHRVSF